MDDGELTWDEVRAVLSAEPMLTARQIRARLERRGRPGLTRKQVNRVLYRSERAGKVTASEDDAPRWALQGAGPVVDAGPEPPARSRPKVSRDPADDEENVRMLFDALD